MILRKGMVYVILAKNKRNKKSAVKQKDQNIESENTIKQIQTEPLTKTENTIESEIESEKNLEDYSIFEYLKNNTSVLIAIVSASVAIIAAVLRFGTYLYHVQYLKYWNIDSMMYSTPETYGFENITVSFILQTFCTLFYIISYKTNKVFINRKTMIKKIKSFIKEEKRDIRQKKKEIKKCKQNKIAIEMQETISKCKFQIKLLKSQKTEIKKILLKEYITNATLLPFLVFVICIILAREANSFFKSLIIAFVFMTIIFGVTYFIAKISNNKSTEIQIKDISKESYPLTELILSDANQLLSNLNIKGFIYYMFVFLSIFLFSKILCGHLEAKNDTDFPVIELNNKEYAIIYSNGEDLVAEEIIINGKNANIYINEQVIVSKEGIKMKVYSFDNILREKN